MIERLTRHGFGSGLSLWLLACGCVAVSAEMVWAEEGPPPARLRRPMALALSADESQLWVANRRSGTVSLCDIPSRKILREIPVAKQLADLTILPDGRLLILDDAAHELRMLSPGIFLNSGALLNSGAGLRVVARWTVPHSPRQVIVSRDGRRAFVTSLWSRQLSLIDLPPENGVQENASSKSELPAAGELVARTDLPFAPGALILVRDESLLIVADAFGGKLAIVDPRSGALVAVRDLPTHHLHGLAYLPDSDQLLVAQQIGSHLAETTANDVHWGILLSNVLRWLPLTSVLDPRTPILEGSHVHPLGEPGRAGGDPADIALGADGRVLITLSGVQEVMWGRERDFSFQRTSVGRRPTAIVTSRDGKRAYVANTFSDSISVLDVTTGQALHEVSLGPQPTLSLADQGELLFYDAKLSLDGWFSCHSCHTEGHTSGLRYDTLGDGGYGASKRTPSLLGTRDTGPWAWDGRFKTLEVQVGQSLSSTMQGSEPSTAQIEALTAFVRTLAPPPRARDLERATTEVQPSAAQLSGRKIFEREQCQRCHRGEAFTSPGTFDVGLGPAGARYNPPSLRGLRYRGPYFHDLRATTLDEVFRTQRHPFGRELTPDDLTNLVDYLRSL